LESNRKRYGHAWRRRLEKTMSQAVPGGKLVVRPGPKRIKTLLSGTWQFGAEGYGAKRRNSIKL